MTRPGGIDSHGLHPERAQARRNALTDAGTGITLDHNQEWFLIDQGDQSIDNHTSQRGALKATPQRLAIIETLIETRSSHPGRASRL